MDENLSVAVAAVVEAGTSRGRRSLVKDHRVFFSQSSFFNIFTRMCGDPYPNEKHSLPMIAVIIS